MKKIRLSYVLGILNAESTLSECLDSIFHQDYPENEYEVIIIDGGSSDKTLKIIREYKKSHNNLRLLHNPKKLSEGKGMSKDLGIMAAKGEFIILLDHDNIILNKNWLTTILSIFKDKKIMAVQSLLGYKKGSNLFLKYINAAGVEDPFAIPYSLVSQVSMHPEKFVSDSLAYYLDLDDKNHLFGGANGCVFRKEVFDIIGGYTRDTDVFKAMSDKKMKVAVAKNVYVFHKTSSDMLKFLIKKGKYISGFMHSGYKYRNFRWVGSDSKGKIKFALIVASNLVILPELLEGLRMFFKSGNLFWILHPFYTFFVTLEYIVISLLNLKGFISYINAN